MIYYYFHVKGWNYILHLWLLVTFELLLCVVRILKLNGGELVFEMISIILITSQNTKRQ